MGLHHAARLAVKRYAPVVKSDVGKRVDRGVNDRADDITFLYVKEKLDNKTGTLKATILPVLYNKAMELMEDKTMIASYDFDGDDRNAAEDAILFEATVLIRMTAVAIAEQEKITGNVTKPELLTDKMLGLMDVVYDEMVKLHRSQQEHVR